MQEIRDVIGYEGIYMVSDDGDVFRVHKGYLKKLNPVLNKDGYLEVNLSKNNETKLFRVHRLVAMAFIKKKNAMYTQINHKDEDKTNNKVSNLEWCTAKYNTNYNGMPYRRAKKLWKPVKAICGEEVYRFPSIANAAHETGVARGNLISCLTGKRKTAGGLRWEYDS